VTLAIVGKYPGMKAAYKSLIEARCTGHRQQGEGQSDWIESEVFENKDPAPFLEPSMASWCRAASASAAPRAKIRAAQFARASDRALFGICFGCQTGGDEADALIWSVSRRPKFTEFGPTSNRFVGLMTEWCGATPGEAVKKRRSRRDYAAGAYPAVLQRGRGLGVYGGATEIRKRHRHRYESQTPLQGPDRAAWSCRFSGLCRMAFCRKSSHMRTILVLGVHFHPELKSRPFEPSLLAPSLRRDGAIAGWCDAILPR